MFGRSLSAPYATFVTGVREPSARGDGRRDETQGNREGCANWVRLIVGASYSLSLGFLNLPPLVSFQVVFQALGVASFRRVMCT